MKIGLLGGAFDPIHVGHLNCANRAAGEFGLDKVYFVPTAIPPHKKKYWASPSDRLAMVKKGVSSNPIFAVSLHEMGCENPSYTIDTVRWFGKKHAADLHYIIGIDAFGEMYSWKSSRELLMACNFIVVSRPGSDMKKAAALVVKKFRESGVKLEYEKKWDSGANGAVLCLPGSGRRIYFRFFPEFGVSSTEIRGLAARGKSIKYLVPDTVAQYIINKGLYRPAPRKP